MKKYILIGLLLFVLQCEAKQCCAVVFDAVNQSALDLEVQCATINQTVESLLTDCCGGGGECPCTPIPVTELTSTITASGYYCLTENVSTIEVTTDNGVVIDLNSYTAGTVTLGDNDIVKNGVVNTIVASANAMIQGVYTSAVFGDGVGSSALLVDVTGLISLNNVERVVMARCMGDGSNMLMIGVGIAELTLYDSLFPWLRVSASATNFERIALYRSIVGGDVEFLSSDSLQEFVCYQSIIAGEILRAGLMPAFKRFFVEESQVGQLAFSLDSAPTQTVNGSVQRSTFKDGISLQGGIGFVVRACEVTGPVLLESDKNIEMNNVSVASQASSFDIVAGENILLTDCCATTSLSNQIGYTLSADPENVNLIRCYAKGCYEGFRLVSLGATLVKDCVCDGAEFASFGGPATASDFVSLGNVSLKIAGVPNIAFTGPDFNPVIVSASSVSTDDADKSIWRNMSFEL